MAKYIVGSLFDKDYPVTQVYGADPNYYKQFGLPGHEGTDYGTPNGTPLLAPFDGVILRDTFSDKDYGNFTVVWDTQQLCAIWFCHLQDVTTNAGDRVTKGQVLGHTNNTGNSRGPHCHVNFVETDADGNRLNKNNGYQGFLNILDTNLVSFSATSSNIGQNDQQLIIDQLRTERDHNWQLYQTDEQTIKNLNQQINDRNNDITMLNAEVQKKETEIQARDQELSIVKLVAATIPQLTSERDQAINDRKLALDAQEQQNKIIAQLKAGKPKGFLNKLVYLFS